MPGSALFFPFPPPPQQQHTLAQSAIIFSTITGDDVRGCSQDVQFHEEDLGEGGQGKAQAGKEGAERCEETGSRQHAEPRGTVAARRGESLFSLSLPTSLLTHSLASSSPPLVSMTLVFTCVLIAMLRVPALSLSLSSPLGRESLPTVMLEFAVAVDMYRGAMSKNKMYNIMQIFAAAGNYRCWYTIELLYTYNYILSLTVCLDLIGGARARNWSRFW